MANIYKKKDTWHIRFYLHGKRYKKSLGISSKHKALRAKQKLEARLADLKSGFLKMDQDVDIANYLISGQTVREKQVTTSQITFDDIVILFLNHVEFRHSPNFIVTEQIHLRHFGKFLKNRATGPISDITLTDIERYMNKRRKKVCADTVNKELQTLRLLFKYAQKHNYIEINPASNVSRFKHSGKSHRFMTKAEIDNQIKRGGLSDKEISKLQKFRYLPHNEITQLLKLAQEKSPFLYPIVATVAFTGIRRGELIALEWAEVDFSAKKIWVRSRKQSRSREFTSRDIDIHNNLLKILKNHHKSNNKGKLVFPWSDGKQIIPHRLHLKFKTLIKNTDFDGIALHCLRHSFASNLAALGVDNRLIDHYMGHQTTEMRQRYQHLFPEKKAEGINKLNY